MTRHIVGSKANHQAAWIGPRLRTKVAYLVNLYPNLFAHLTANCLLKRLARLYKTRNKPIVLTSEVTSVNHENLLVFPTTTSDAYNNSGLKLGPEFLATIGALLANLGLPFHRCSATTTILTVLVKIKEFGTLSSQLIIRNRKYIKTLTEGHHDEIV